MSQPLGRQLKRPTTQAGRLLKKLSTPDILRDYPEILGLHQDRLRMEIQPATPTLVFFHDSPRLKCCLNDRGMQQSLFVTCDTWEQAYDRLNAELGKAKPDWRPYKPWGKSRE
jgi:hypothetical protein